MPARLWELGVGCLLFLGLKQFNGVPRHLEKVPPLLLLAGVVGVLFVPLKFAVSATIAVVVLTAALIACLRSGTAGYKVLTRQTIVYIGLISYSLYLWHWGVLSLSRWTIGIHWWSVPFQIALMLSLASASHRYVETPLRRSDWSSYRWQSIGYGIGACAVAGGLLTGLDAMQTPSLYTGRRPDLVAVGPQSLTEPYLIKGPGTRWQGEKCVLSDNSQVGKRLSLEECTLGHFATAKRRVLVIGNSFSAAFTQAFDELVAEDGYAVAITSCWGASVVPQLANDGPWNKANDYYWESVVPSLVSHLKRGDWVFLIGDMAEFSPKQKSPESSERLQQLKSGLVALSTMLSSKGARLAVLHGNPFAREASCRPVLAAKQWFNSFTDLCRLPNRRKSLLRRKELDTVLVSLEHEGMIRVVDLFDLFCPGEECTYNAANGQILYRDEWSHPSVEAVRLSAAAIRRVLTSTD